MKAALRKPSLGKRVALALPVLILLVAGLLTGLYWNETRRLAEHRAQLAFEHLSERLVGELQERMRANEQVLRAVVGLFDSSDGVDRHEFRTFVAALNLEERYPGIQGIGFSLRVPAAELASHVRSIRAEGFPDYRIRPPGERDPYSAIIYLEPFDWRNQRAFGYDMFSEPVRHQAMARARDTGRAALSGKVTLVQETESDVQAGFLLYVPVFRHGAAAANRVPQPADLIGWAYSPIRMNDMMSGLFAREQKGMLELIDVTIHDGQEATPQSLLFASHPEPLHPAQTYRMKRHLSLAGHGWTVTVHALPAFHAQYQGDMPRLVIVAGIAITLLLSLLASVIARSHVRIARSLEDTAAANRELAASQQALRDSSAELTRHRGHLEELVHTRTAELAAARDAAEAASRAKTAFLANMSHELRTPMNGVLGMIELVRRRTSDPEALDKLAKAKTSANRLLDVLNDILDLSKIEAERMVLEDAPLQLADSVDNIVGTLGHKAAEKRVDLSVDIPPTLAHVPLMGDPLRLGQILINLVGNAIKFTEQGEVTLRARLVEDTSEVAHVRFEVVDTGIGIDAEAQTRLFQSFEQADNSMTRKYGGTGLGLAICKRLVQMMGGEIGVESAPGRGSTFWFVVPLKKRESSAVTPAPTFSSLRAEQRLQSEFAGTRVLVAEDEPITQIVTCGLLEDVGLVADLAEDGQQALQLARQNRYALIFMDMQMPVMNGVEATQAIRADSLNRETPILAMTANAFDEDREACLAAGMNEHISKPVDPQKLYETLLEWLRKHGNGR